MKNQINKFIGIGVAAFVIFFCVITFFMSGRDSEVFMTTYGLYLSYILAFLALAAVVFGAVLSLAAKPQSAITSLLGVVGVAALFGISYALTSGEEYANIDAGTVHMIAALLMMTYLCLAIATLGIIYLIVSAAFK